MARARIAVLASGGGTNLQAILDYFDQMGEARSGDVVVVASNRAKAGALARASTRGIPTALLATETRPQGAALDAVLAEHRVDLVALAGYLQRVSPTVVRALEGRILNVHPALLPAFGGTGMYGRHVHDAVIASGVPTTGVTVHTIDEEYDRGQIIAQWPVSVYPEDDATTLGARVLAIEHLLFPRIIDTVAALLMAPPPSRSLFSHL